MTPEQMLANLSKRLDNRLDCSEGLFHFSLTELSQDLNSTFAFTVFKREARRRDGGKGEEQQLDPSSKSSTLQGMKTFQQTVSNAKVS